MTTEVMLKSHLFQKQQPFKDQQLLSPLMKMPSVKPVKKPHIYLLPVVTTVQNNLQLKNHNVNLKTTFKLSEFKDCCIWNV